MDDDGWYYVRGYKAVGPVSVTDLMAFARAQADAEALQVWRRGLPDWRAAGEVAEIALQLAAAAARGTASPNTTAAQERSASVLVGASASEPAPPLPPQAPPVEPPPLPTPPVVGKRRNYFVRHWRGELSLPVSYWLNGWLGAALVGVAATMLRLHLDSQHEYSPGIALTTVVAIYAAAYASYVWLVVGIWRSAMRYQQSKKVWGTVAQIVIALNVVMTLFDFRMHTWPQVAEMYDIYRGDEDLGPHAFHVLAGGEELQFSGGITFGTAKELSRFLDAMSDIKRVVLDSPGGRVGEALAMAEEIESRKLDTLVRAVCASACTDVFLAGQSRLITPDAKLGFHQPDFSGLTEADRANVVSGEKQRLRSLGISQPFIDKALSIRPDDMWFPTAADLVRARVATALVDAKTLARIDPAPVGASGASAPTSRSALAVAQPAMPVPQPAAPAVASPVSAPGPTAPGTAPPSAPTATAAIPAATMAPTAAPASSLLTAPNARGRGGLSATERNALMTALLPACFKDPDILKDFGSSRAQESYCVCLTNELTETITDEELRGYSKKEEPARKIFTTKFDAADISCHKQVKARLAQQLAAGSATPRDAQGRGLSQTMRASFVPGAIDGCYRKGEKLLSADGLPVQKRASFCSCVATEAADAINDDELRAYRSNSTQKAALDAKVSAAQSLCMKEAKTSGLTGTFRENYLSSAIGLCGSLRKIWIDLGVPAEKMNQFCVCHSSALANIFSDEDARRPGPEGAIPAARLRHTNAIFDSCLKEAKEVRPQRPGVEPLASSNGAPAAANRRSDAGATVSTRAQPRATKPEPSGLTPSSPASPPAR